MKADIGTPEQQLKRAYLMNIDKDPCKFEVERLADRGVITIENAIAGKRLYVWHYAAIAQQDARAIDMSREIFGGHGGDANLNRLTASCRYFKTMTQIRAKGNAHKKPYVEILRAICIDELCLEKMAKRIKKRRITAEEWMADAFDELVFAQQSVFELEEKTRY